MGEINYPLGAATFNQFKKRYSIFTTFFGVILLIIFFIRGNSLDVWQKLPFYQVLSILLLIFYIIVAVFIYHIFKKNYTTKSKNKI